MGEAITKVVSFLGIVAVVLVYVAMLIPALMAFAAPLLLIVGLIGVGWLFLQDKV